MVINHLFLVFIFSFSFFFFSAEAANFQDNRDNCLDKSKELKSYLSHTRKNLNGFQNFLPALKNTKKQEEIIQLLTEVRKRELENQDKYQVVTAQDSQFFAYQVIAKEIYEKLHKRKIQDFEFLRYPHKDLNKNLEEFYKQNPLLKNRSGPGSPCPSLDLLPKISYQIISVSFSMETSTFVDSSLFVFLFGKGIAEWSNAKENEEKYHKNFIERVEEIFIHAGVKKNSYMPYLKQLIDTAPRTKEGIINQIFLNKENIHRYLYISLPLGLVDTAQNANIQSVFSKFQKERLSQDFNCKKNLQGRLLAGALFDGQVSIYRYTLIPEKEQIAYKKLVKEIIEKILR